jgi:uncharacterized repeat protein (TIGR01451 family)
LNKNKIGVVALTAALIFVPFAPALNALAMARGVQQESDVPSDAEQAMFTRGQNLYNQGRYDQAATVLQDFLKTYPRSIITDLTLLWLGRSYMQLGKFQEAEQVGQRLRTIKDTPFADIYEGELQTARRESATGALASNTGTATAPPPTSRNSRVPARGPAAKPLPLATPTPTPTPRLIGGGSRPATPQRKPLVRPTPTPTPATATTAQAGIEGVRTAVPQARKLSDPAGTSTDLARTEPTLPSRRIRNSRASRRINRPAPAITPETVAGNNTSVANQTPTPSAPAIKPTRPRTQPGTQVAVNNPPRINPPVSRPAARPASTPVERPPVTNPATNNPPASMVTGAATSMPVAVPTPAETSLPQSGGLSLTVKQVPNLVLALRRSSESAQPGQSVQLPLTVTNTGNKEDQFRLETDLPAEFQPSFSLAQGGAGSELPILVTPQLARGASVEVLLNLRIPETAADGLQRRFLVSAASQADYQIQKIADGSINVVAAALDAASNVSLNSIMPGDSFTQTITVRNAGSSPARSARADFVFNPSFELVSANPSPIQYDRASRTAIWSLGDLGSRNSREISVTLRALPDALAATSPLGRGTVRTQSLPTASNFDSPSVTVGKVPRVRIDAVSIGLTATPGDTIFIPFVVRNPGNSADSYALNVTAPGAPAAAVYADTNGDGQHQESEPAVTQTAQLDPRDGQFPMLLRVQIPASTPDRQQFSYNVVARSSTSGRVASEANTVLTVATPRVRVRTERVTDTSAPGDTIYYRLVLVNEGSGLAKNLVVAETLPGALEFVNSDPALNPQDAPSAAQRITWRVPELAPGDTTVLRIAVRLRPNLPADTNLTTQHTLGYQDTNGNNYSGQ